MNSFQRLILNVTQIYHTLSHIKGNHADRRNVDVIYQTNKCHDPCEDQHRMLVVVSLSYSEKNKSTIKHIFAFLWWNVEDEF